MIAAPKVSEASKWKRVQFWHSAFCRWDQYIGPTGIPATSTNRAGAVFRSTFSTVQFIQKFEAIPATFIVSLQKLYFRTLSYYELPFTAIPSAHKALLDNTIPDCQSHHVMWLRRFLRWHNSYCFCDALLVYRCNIFLIFRENYLM